MSTVMRVNFVPVQDILPVQRKDFQLADSSLADPMNAVALVDGEWMAVNNDYKIERASTIGSVGNEAAKRSYPLFAERGRYDVQALGERAMPVLWLSAWEFNTRIFDAAVAVGSGAAITAVDQPLKVATITIGTRNYTGLVGHGGSGDSAIVVGYVTRLPANNGGKLRLRGGMLY